MPKVKQRKSAKLAQYVAQFPIFKTDGEVLYCKACNKCVTSERMFFIKSHLASKLHIEANEKLSKSTQAFLGESKQSKQTEFVNDMCKAFVSSDIPLYKIRNKNLKDFFDKYVQFTVPSESTMRTTVCSLYEQTIDIIKTSIKDKYLWISIDETTDASGRYIGNVVLGIIDTDQTVAKQHFLLHVCELQKADHSSIARLFENALNVLGPNFNKDCVLLFVTDAAPYMVKAAKALQVLYPKLTHITCLAHGLHRICEKIRDLNPKVDQLIANIKKVFLKAPTRVEIFKNSEPDLSLPPEPVITRWGTWMEAVNYYCKNFEKIRGIFDLLSSDDSKYIKICKNLLNDESVRQQIIAIESNFGFLPKSIKILESSTQPLASQIKIISDAQELIDQSGCDEVIEKLNSILTKNTGYIELKNISNQISGRKTTVGSNSKYTLAETCSFKYAPITSVEVERTFSMFNSVYRENRQSFLFENLAQVMVVYCNNNLSQII